MVSHILLRYRRYNDLKTVNTVELDTQACEVRASGADNTARQ
jgi:hypothetical protein